MFDNLFVNNGNRFFMNFLMAFMTKSREFIVVIFPWIIIYTIFLAIMFMMNFQLCFCV